MERRHPLSIAERPPRVNAGVTFASAALALLCGACTEVAPEARGAAAAAPTAIPVVTRPARIEQMGIEIEAVGTTQANESVEVTSKASNTVTAIRFQEGEEVARGAVLVEMDSSEARANLAEAQASLARSKSQHNRSLDLQSRQVCRSRISSKSKPRSKPTKRASLRRSLGSTTP
jgi:membrane fusion protein (multidrug efflux system)